MAKIKQHGMTLSDLGGSDWDAVCTDLDTGVTDSCILDNRKSGSGKYVLVRMSPDLGTHWQTLPQGYMSPGEFDKADLSVLGIAVNCFEVAWKIGGGPWIHNGVCATPGKYFKAIGAVWDEHDNAHLISVVAP